jgi:hypothetical protein
MPESPKVMPCPRCRGTKKFNNRPCALCRASGGVEKGMRFTTVTHVAERAIDIHGRVIQRCVWCGHKLIDALVKEQPLDGRGKPKPIFAWMPGDMVRVPSDGPQDKDGTGKRLMVGHMNTDQLPADFCYELVEQG